MGWEGMDLIGVAEYRDKWWSCVNMDMNLLVP